MKILLIPLCVLLFLLLFPVLWDLKFGNPYSIECYIGKRGTGKSTILTKLALKYIKKGWRVYTTENIPFTYHIDYEDIGYKFIPENSVLLLDEAGIQYDARNFKNFDKRTNIFYKMSRHARVKTIFFSQSYTSDLDLKIRLLVDRLYLLKRFGPFCIARKLRIVQTLIHSSAQSEARICDDIQKSLFGISFTYLPRYFKYFDSFDLKLLDLAPKDFEKHPVDSKLLNRLSKKERKILKDFL